MYFLLVVYGDVQPMLRGPYASDVERVSEARKYRARRGDRDGLFRIDVRPLAMKPAERIGVRPFGGAELAS